MTPTQVNKLYPKMTPHEQAALAFEAIARNDSAETSLITNSVTQINYRCTHWDYRHRLSGLFSLGNLYGLTYWKTRTYMAVSDNRHQEDDPATQEASFKFLGELLAMEDALVRICGTLNIDAELVKRYAQCEDEAVISGEGDPALVAEYVSLFMGVLE